MKIKYIIFRLAPCSSGNLSALSLQIFLSDWIWHYQEFHFPASSPPGEKEEMSFLQLDTEDSNKQARSPSYLQVHGNVYLVYAQNSSSKKSFSWCFLCTPLHRSVTSELNQACSVFGKEPVLDAGQLARAAGRAALWSLFVVGSCCSGLVQGLLQAEGLRLPCLHSG